MSWCADPKYLKTIALLVCLTMGHEATAGPLPSALSDLRPIPPLSEIECPKTGAEPKAAAAPHEIEGLVGGTTLNYTQALGNLKAALEGSVGPEAMKAIEASPQARDPAAASRVAVIALAAEKPLATVAYAVKAHETAPGEPQWLSNLASIANYYGLHREALAFTVKAESLPKKLPAFQHGVLLTNKGYALNSLGRPKEAEAALAEAIRLAPDLSEAYTNIAFSLGDQDKCEQAVRYMRAGTTRRPAEVFKSSTQAEAEMPTRIPLSQVLDLSKGKAGVLPPVPYTVEPGEAAAVRKMLDSLKKLTEAAPQQFQEQVPKAMEGILARRSQWAEQGVAGALTADFAEALLNALQEYTIEIIVGHQNWLGGAEQAYHQDPEIRDLAKTVVQASYKVIRTNQTEDEIWEPRVSAINREYNLARERCGKRNDYGNCMSLPTLKKNTGMCVLGKELGVQREKSARAYDRALRELYAESFRRASALAAYFSDPAHKALAKPTLEYYAAVSYDRLLGGSYGVLEMLERVVSYCEASNQTPMDILFDQLKQMAEECKASGPAPKASIGILEVQADCEKVEIGLSTPGPVGLFGQVSYKESQRYRRLKDGKERFIEKQAGRDPDVALNLPGYGNAFDGELTVFAGVQGKVSGGGGSAEAGGKAGGYTTFKGDGTIAESGGKFSVSASGQTGAGGVGAGVEAGTSWTSKHGWDD